MTQEFNTTSSLGRLTLNILLSFAQFEREIIGERTRVVNSYIGPFTSVAADCEVVDSELDHSVVLQGSRILGIDKLTDSLVGRKVEVVRSDRRPHALRLMLGDHSKVELE